MYVEQTYRLTPARLARIGEAVQLLDLAPGPGGSHITPLGPHVQAACAAILEGWLDRAWHQALIIALEPSAQLVAHCDAPIVGRRYHLPLVVNPGCWVFHAGTWQQLKAGHLYRMDPTEPHGAVNWGTTRRTHLIVDVVEPLSP